MTREEVEAEAWFGGQKERVLRLVAERDAAEALTKALQSRNEALVERVRVWQDLATANARERDEYRESCMALRKLAGLYLGERHGAPGAEQ
jgi:hypothetical protein